MSAPRQRLLEAAVSYVADHGLTGRSLRELAAALGTSHRMLLHHFGSKEGLWAAVVREVEERQRTALAEVVPDPSLTPRDALLTWWQHISDPSLWPNARLFFELYGQGLQGRPGAVDLLDGVVEDWLGPAAALAEAQGLTPADARAEARLGLAVTRGLLLDLLATGDRAGVDAAWAAYVDAYLQKLPATS